jgi:hypothetical protein
MTHKTPITLSIGVLLAAGVFGSALGQDISAADFLSDYSQLERLPDVSADYIYSAPDGPSRMANYTAIMIDQPEVFVASDSDYKGMKADDMQALADAFRLVLAESLGEDYLIVDQAGPTVLYLRFALVDLYLTKRRRGFLSYTPIGLAATAVRSATSDLNVINKIDLNELSIEMELLDSESGEQFAAIIETRSEAAEEPASWEDLEALLGDYGLRIRCKLNNATTGRQPVDCRVVL